MKVLSEMKVKIFADGADKEGMLEMYKKPYIKGFTTNPTLMRKAGIANYESFAKDIICAIPDRPMSFEVFSDDFCEMEKQAREITTWGRNVYVKIPITNTKRVPCYDLIKKLSCDGIKLNITAMLTETQVQNVLEKMCSETSCYISVFAGRIADTGRDPVPVMSTVLDMLKEKPNAELIWASPRELFNIIQADNIGCHIITVANDILKKLALIGKDLDEYSLETVKMFYDDAKMVGYSILC